MSELYFPEDTSTGHYLTGIAEALAEHFDVAVMCGQPSYAHRGTRAPRTEWHRGVRILRCRATRFNKDRLVLRILNWLTLTVSVALTAVRSMGRGDVALVVTTPPTLPFAVMCASLVRRTPYVVLVHDVYPEALAVVGAVARDGLAYRVLDRAFTTVYRRAERVIVLGRDMRDLLVRRDPTLEPTLMVIPNWADIDVIAPSPRAENAVLEGHDLQEEFVVQVAGNLGLTHGLEDLVDAVEQAACEKLTLLVSGFGAKRALLEAKARTRPYLRVVERVPKHALADLLNACDVAVVPLIEGMAGVSVPSRTYNYLAAGKPIIAIADVDSELAQLICEEQVGWVVAPGDIDGLAKVLTEARHQPAMLAAMGRRARIAAERRYSPDEIQGRYVQLFTALL